MFDKDKKCGRMNIAHFFYVLYFKLRGDDYMVNLNNFDIAKDDFSILTNNINNEELLKYYLIKKAYADMLVNLEEFVGKTYDNLEKIEKKINLK